MNKNLYTFLGGDPLYLDDLEFVQDAVIDAIKGILSLTGTVDDSFIISGCGVTYDGITYTIASGYICYKGELCKVDSHTSTALNYWGLDLSYDADGNQTFADGLVHDTQQIRKAKVTTAIPADYIAYSSVTQLYAKLQTRLALAHIWQTTFAFNTDYSNYGAPYFDVAFKRDEISGVVNIRGHAKKGTPATHITDIKILTLSDAALIPASEQYLISAGMGSDFTNSRPTVVIIKTDGTVWIKADATHTFSSGDINFDGLQYSL